MKRLFTLITLLALTIGIVGCNKPADTTTATDTNAVTTPPVTTPGTNQ